MTKAEMQGWARLAQAARDHSMKWKKIPASDARLLAMAGRIVLEENQEYLGQMERSLKNLDKDERETFEKFRKEISLLLTGLTHG